MFKTSLILSKITLMSNIKSNNAEMLCIINTALPSLTRLNLKSIAEI